MNDLTFSGLLLLKPLNGDEIPYEKPLVNSFFFYILPVKILDSNALQ